MDAAQWSQQMASNLQRPMEEVTSSPTTPNTNPNNPTNPRGGVTQQEALERRTRPQKDQNLGCPRCHSTNTKFCYYNNYSLTQPRYFCKTCRRYWTQGGSLRSVPVGGGSRKNKRSSSSSSILASPQPLSQSTTTSLPSMHNKLMIPDLNPPTSLSHLLTSSQNPNIKFLEGHDLNLAFPMQSLFHHHIDHQLPKIEGNHNPNENHEPPINLNPNNMSTNNSISTKTTTTTTPTSTPFSALELLRTGIASRGNLNPYAHMPMPGSSTLFQSGYPNMQEFKPSMNMFSPPSDHHNNMDGSNDHHHHHHHNESHNNDDHNIVQSGARLLFPFADMNKLATNTQQHHDDHNIDENDQSKGNGNDDHHHDLNHHHSGYWSGMLGGGTW